MLHDLVLPLRPARPHRRRLLDARCLAAYRRRTAAVAAVERARRLLVLPSRSLRRARLSPHHRLLLVEELQPSLRQREVEVCNGTACLPATRRETDVLGVV